MRNPYRIGHSRVRRAMHSDDSHSFEERRKARFTIERVFSCQPNEAGILVHDVRVWAQAD